MAKHKNDYFRLIEQQVEYCVKAAYLLEELLYHYSSETMAGQHDRIHEIERQADDIHHDILTRLSAEFITPIDQEDILRLVQIVDDVTDSLDEVVMECYMFHIEALAAGAPEFAGIVSRCVRTLYAAAQEFRNFKNPKKLHSLLVEINTIESEADAAYMEAIHHLFGSETDFKRLIGAKAIFDCLEECCDLCEHAADVMNLIIIKNT